MVGKTKDSTINDLKKFEFWIGKSNIPQHIRCKICEFDVSDNIYNLRRHHKKRHRKLYKKLRCTSKSTNNCSKRFNSKEVVNNINDSKSNKINVNEYKKKNQSDNYKYCKKK